MIVITAIMKAKEGSGDDLEKVIKSFAPKFLKDPGVAAYQAHRRVDNPNVFFFYEKYENDEALKFHSAAPHFKEMFVAMKPFLEGKAEIAMLREI
jgi:quinol monooxygenase YgiN